LEPVLDRFQEAHFWIHMLEQYYHNANPFRWYLSAYLKSIKEAPKLLQLGLQNQTGFSEWFSPKLAQLNRDPLINDLSKRRDHVVHKGMLLPSSSGFIGITEGRGLKLGIGIPIDPRTDSDEAMRYYLLLCASEGDPLQILSPDEDSVPCVEREWRLPQFEGDIVDVCATAWVRVGELITATLTWLGEDPPPLSLECRHASQEVRIKTYDRNQLMQQLADISSESRLA